MSLAGLRLRPNQHHLLFNLPFGVKLTRILKNAIVKLDDLTSCNRSTSYSYWCSHLKQTTHIACSPNHVPYSVTLGTKGSMISRLPTRASTSFLDKAAICFNQNRPLYTTFIVYFNGL